jgi:hypothetical protein
MQRALHYGKSMGFGTGTNAQGTFGAGTKRAFDDRGDMQVPAELAGDSDTDIVFILGPLNELAVTRIKDSIAQSISDKKKVEVYMQAFTEPDPDGVINAPNLLPMNFNQYSSDDPNALVGIINDNIPNKDVTFYIFPTQTTKNKYFWSKKAQAEFVSGLETQADKIDASILTSIVTWLKKDDDVEKDGIPYDLKDMNYTQLQDYSQNPEKVKELVDKLRATLDKTSDDIETESKAVLAIFDPFCAFCAAHCIEGQEAKFSNVPGSHKLVARSVIVTRNTKPTPDERDKDGIAESPFLRPRFEYTDSHTNCYVVTWGHKGSMTDAERKAAAGDDGIAYIKELWSSFMKGGSASQGRRMVNRILIVQDYYDYDNKMSVWYILHAFNAKVIELYSVTRPVAEKEVMRAMREKKGAFAAAGGFPLKPSALSDEAIDEWRSKEGPTYPVASPVFTQKNFAPGDVKVDGELLTFKRFKKALHMTPARIAESEAESGHIAYTWSKFIAHMLEYNNVGNPDARLYVTNGGYTNRHGLNPALHTIIEDWYKDHWFPVDRRMPVDILKKRQKA